MSDEPVDIRVCSLAQSFTSGYPGLTDEDAADLAICIQNEIEGWFEGKESSDKHFLDAALAEICGDQK